ncbi:MAG: hypothetical protein AB8F34_06755 [Akkermansiaceae bacterium]
MVSGGWPPGADRRNLWLLPGENMSARSGCSFFSVGGDKAVLEQGMTYAEGRSWGDSEVLGGAVMGK